jgi:hypothetical protein
MHDVSCSLCFLGSPPRNRGEQGWRRGEARLVCITADHFFVLHVASLREATLRQREERKQRLLISAGCGA